MTSRDLIAPDTEPTDEELALVMREARELGCNVAPSPMRGWLSGSGKPHSLLARTPERVLIAAFGD